MIVYDRPKKLIGEIRQSMRWNSSLNKYEYPLIVDTSKENDNSYCIFVSDLKKYLKNNLSTVKSIPEKSKLYFDKSSKFPRFKLEQTDYKRCIKIDKADYIVAKAEAPSCNYYTAYVSIIETPDGYYGTRENLTKTDCHNLLNVVMSSIIIHNDSIKYKLTQSELVYLNCITNKYSVPMILDDDLNSTVDKLNPVLTIDDVDQIYTMLKSSDPETAGLGLKILTNYNVSETPCSTRFILGSTHNEWRWSNAKTGVSVKNMLESIDYYRIYRTSFPDILYYCKKNDEEMTDTDKQLMQHLIMRKTEDYIKATNYNIIDQVGKFGINVEITISKNE